MLKGQNAELSLTMNTSIQLYYVYVTVSGMSSEPSSLKEEVFWLVAHMATVASNPALMVTSLMEFLSEYIKGLF